MDGSGVTVGVISDGILGLASAIAFSDLPATTLNRDGAGKLVSNIGGIISTSLRADGDLEGGLGSSTGAEGTAILEIVHDIAPGAQLRFANFSTSLEFIAAVDFLAANSDVVIDDIGFFGFAYDQTSPVSANTSQELNRLSNPIRGYYTAVGNHALRHYQELYLDSGTDGGPTVGTSGNLHRYSATGNTTDCYGLGSTTTNSIEVGPRDTASVWLTWDDTFGATTTDYDLYVFRNDNGALVDFSIDDNVGVTGDPVESVTFTNNTGTSHFYELVIQNFENASLPKTFDMFVMRGGTPCPNGPIFNYNTIASSVPAQSDSGGGVVSVGAINASDPGVDDIESFSSHGPANNGEIKPDVAAVDGVSVIGFGGFPSTFFGTSAAALHVAGLAALLLDLRPELMSGEPGDDPAADRAALRAAIVNGAVDLGISGVDNTFGHGRVNGPASAALLGGFPAEITVTESISVAEALGVIPPAQVIVSEAVSAADASGVFPPAGISVIESVNVNDSLEPGTPSALSPLTSIPALTVWGLMGMALLVGVLLVIHLRRRTLRDWPSLNP